MKTLHRGGNQMNLAAKVAIVASLVPGLLAFAGAPATPATPTATAEQTAACRKAERLGRAIYEQDVVSSEATDALAAKVDLSKENRVQGWIAIKKPGAAWLVRFVNAGADAPAALYDVAVGADGTHSVVPHDPPVVLDETEAGMFRARQAALAAMPSRCGRQYNTVILPGEGEDADGWLVYLLGATDKPREVVVGGHFRAGVSRDGRRVREISTLTQGCTRSSLDEAKAPADGESAAFFIAHRISPTPNETHVFLSLLHEIPIYVGTDVGVWIVADGQIRYASVWPKDEALPSTLTER